MSPDQAEVRTSPRQSEGEKRGETPKSWEMGDQYKESLDSCLIALVDTKERLRGQETAVG